MSFLAPLFMLGGLAIAGPILFHLIRRSPEKRQEFSSLMFLEPDPPVFSKRSRISHWLLLLLRCLVILLLSLAFARPFLRTDDRVVAPGGLVTHWMIVVDRSASMNRDGVDDAVARSLREALDGSRPGDLALLAAFDGDFEILADWQPVESSTTTSAFDALIRQTPAGFGSTRLGPSLVQAAQIMDDRMAETGSRGSQVAGHIVLISDFQKGAQLDSVQGFEWNELVDVALVSVGSEAPPNAGLALLESDRPGFLRVQVSNDAENLNESFQVVMTGQTSGNVEPQTGEESDAGAAPNEKSYPVRVPAGSSRVISIPMDSTDWANGQLELRGEDSSNFDNTVYWAGSRVGNFNIRTFGLGDENASGTMAFFLQRAFGADESMPVDITPLDSISDLVAGAQYFLIGAGLQDLPDLDDLRQRLEQGVDFLWLPRSPQEFNAVRTALALGTGVEPDQENDGDGTATATATVPVMTSPVTVENSRSMVLLEEIDWTHPVFQPFRDPQFSNFSKVGFYRYLKLPASWVEPAGGRVVASLEGDSPWLVEFVVGDGRLWIMTSGWESGESVLARSSKFLPVLLSLAQSTGAWRSGSSQYSIGDAWKPFESDVALRTPDGRSIEVAAGESFPGLEIPGLVTVAGPRGEYAIPVNLDPRESLCSPSAVAQLETLGVPLNPVDVEERDSEQARAAAELAATKKDTEVESAQKNWKWVVAIVAAILILETWLAGWTSRRQAAIPAGESTV